MARPTPRGGVPGFRGVGDCPEPLNLSRQPPSFVGTMAASRTRFEHAEPILRVEDMARSLRYYTEILGFAAEDWSGDEFGCVSRDGASIYLSLRDQGQPGTWVWVGVEDVAALFDEYAASRAEIAQAPKNFPWALEMHVIDPDGHVLRFGSEPRQDIPFD